MSGVFELPSLGRGIHHENGMCWSQVYVQQWRQRGTTGKGLRVLLDYCTLLAYLLRNSPSVIIF